MHELREIENLQVYNSGFLCLLCLQMKMCFYNKTWPQVTNCIYLVLVCESLDVKAHEPMSLKIKKVNKEDNRHRVHITGIVRRLFCVTQSAIKMHSCSSKQLRENSLFTPSSISNRSLDVQNGAKRSLIYLFYLLRGVDGYVCVLECITLHYSASLSCHCDFYCGFPKISHWCNIPIGGNSALP